jgi:hypothetical protein
MVQKENTLKQIYSVIEKGMGSNNTQDPASSVYFRKGYRSYQISKNNFSALSKRVSDKKTCFVDGGNSLLIDTPSLALGFVRVAAVIVEHNKCIKTSIKEFFVLARTVSIDGHSNDPVNNPVSLAKSNSSTKMAYQVTIYPENSEKGNSLIISDFELDPEEPGLVKNDDEFRPSNAVSIARRLSEIKLAEGLVKELDSGDMLLLDGSLRASTTNEDSALNNLYLASMKKNVLVCAISKTCSIITNSGESLINAVSSISEKDKIWFYHPIAESVSEMHKAKLFLVKLNKKSEHIFTLEIYRSQAKGADYHKIIGFLAYMSRDLTFPGYPYWLIKVDMIARVANEENEMLITRFFAMNKGARKMLLPLIKAVDAHSILDNIR